jgi:membrane protease YdiL (CAAX protease family)
LTRIIVRWFWYELADVSLVLARRRLLLNEPVCYLALAAYPALVLFVFDWWNAGWGSKNRSFFLPPELKKKTEDANRPFALVRYALLLLVLRGLAGAGLWYIVPIPTRFREFFFFVGLGIAGGLVMLAFRHAFSISSPIADLVENHEYFLRGSTLLWVVIFIIGGVVEEFWRAVWIVSFRENGYRTSSVLLLTALAFALAHLCGLPSRINPGIPSLLAEIMVGLMLGGLFIWSGNMVAPCVASVIYFTLSFFLVRRRFGRPTPDLIPR